MSPGGRDRDFQEPEDREETKSWERSKDQVIEDKEETEEWEKAKQKPDKED